MDAILEVKEGYTQSTCFGNQELLAEVYSHFLVNSFLRV